MMGFLFLLQMKNFIFMIIKYLINKMKVLNEFKLFNKLIENRLKFSHLSSNIKLWKVKKYYDIILNIKE